MVSIFDKEAFAEEVAKLESILAKADTITHRTSRTIYERMGEDPVFYQRFSDMLQKVIDDYRRKRIDENAYLNHVTEIMAAVINRTGDDIVHDLSSYETAKAYYGIINQKLADTFSEENKAEIALAIDRIIEQKRIVQWVDNQDIQNRMRTEIEDWLFDYAQQNGVTIDFGIVDDILDRCIDVAKFRRADVR